MKQASVGLLGPRARRELEFIHLCQRPITMQKIINYSHQKRNGNIQVIVKVQQEIKSFCIATVEKMKVTQSSRGIQKYNAVSSHANKSMEQSHSGVEKQREVLVQFEGWFK